MSKHRRFHLLAGIIGAGLSLLTAGAQPAKTYSTDEMIVLNSVSGFGDRGEFSTSKDITAPGSDLGFSLRFSWRHHPGLEPFWSVRQRLPSSVNMNEYDTFSCDLYVESTKGGMLTLYLIEPNDDRWICWDQALDNSPQGRWIHIEVKRADMRPWLLGKVPPDWSHINALAIEPHGGDAVFYLDNVHLTGPNGHSVSFFNTDDEMAEGALAPPSAMNPVPKEGTIYFPDVAGQSLGATAQEFKALFGDFGTTARDPATVGRMNALGIPVIYYAGYAEGFEKYLTRRNAWDEDSNGDSPEKTPFSVNPFLAYHTIAYAHPAVFDVGKQKVDALVRMGLNAWMVVDYTFPYGALPMGYSPIMVAAYRKDLAGADDGLYLRGGAKQAILHFPDYFRGYNGFYPQPAALNLDTWDDFTPPPPGGTDVLSRAKWTLFLYLRSYEWLKLADRTGRYFQATGGQGLWIMPNPEDSWGSSDYVFLERSAGVANLFPEWFGNVGLEAEAGYASLPYLREQADQGHSRLSGLYETGAGGHTQPYWDWRVAYDGVYAVTAESRASDMDNDFVDEVPYDEMKDPHANLAQFQRFRDGVTKALAFQQARSEKPKRPPSAILCVSDRPPARAVNSFFFLLNQPYTLATALSRAHFAFDLRDSLNLESVLGNYRVAAYSPMNPRVGDAGVIRKWLEAKAGRILITHSFVPTRDAAGYWGMDRSFDLGHSNGGPLLGLGNITTTAATHCTITTVADGWKDFFTPGQSIDLPTPLTRCDNGETLVMTDAGPLISRARIGGSQVIYLHFAPADPMSPGILPLTVQVMKAVGKAAGISPVCDADSNTLVQVFGVSGCRSVVAWDAPGVDGWKFESRPGIDPLHYDAPGVDRTIRIPADGAGVSLVYSFWDDHLERRNAVDGFISLPLKNAMTALYYVGPDNAQTAAVIASAQHRRGQLRELHFDGVP